MCVVRPLGVVLFFLRVAPISLPSSLPWPTEGPRLKLSDPDDSSHEAGIVIIMNHPLVDLGSFSGSNHPSIHQSINPVPSQPSTMPVTATVTAHRPTAAPFHVHDCDPAASSQAPPLHRQHHQRHSYSSSHPDPERAAAAALAHSRPDRPSALSDSHASPSPRPCQPSESWSPCPA